MHEEPLSAQRRALSDYRIALGLELRARREKAGRGFAELSAQARIPDATLRSYERGDTQPQIMRIADIGAVYGVSTLDILNSASEYIYRAHGEPLPDSSRISLERISLRSVLLYCGLTPAQLSVVESPPPFKSIGQGSHDRK